jgi:hypothetical protein
MQLVLNAAEKNSPGRSPSSCVPRDTLFHLVAESTRDWPLCSKATFEVAAQAVKSCLKQDSFEDGVLIDAAWAEGVIRTHSEAIVKIHEIDMRSCLSIRHHLAVAVCHGKTCPDQNCPSAGKAPEERMRCVAVDSEPKEGELHFYFPLGLHVRGKLFLKRCSLCKAVMWPSWWHSGGDKVSVRHLNAGFSVLDLMIVNEIWVCACGVGAEGAACVCEG